MFRIPSRWIGESSRGYHISSRRQPTRHKLLLSKKKICLNQEDAFNNYSYHTESGVFGYTPRLHGKPYQVSETVLQNRCANSNLYRLIEAYQCHGHKQAALDPLARSTETQSCMELKPSFYCLSEDNSEKFNLHGLVHSSSAEGTLADVVSHLQKSYCGHIAVEFQYLQDLEQREWLAEKVETLYRHSLTDEMKRLLAVELLKSQTFDNFVGSKFATVKRYGGEGSESMMGFFTEVLLNAADYGIVEVIMAMPHRGRLNLLTGLLKFPPVEMFRKMKGFPEFPPDVAGSGDVLSHLTSSVDINFAGKTVRATMLPNPSHLEAVSPVAVGKARSRQRYLKDGDYADDNLSSLGDKVLCVQVHGDASFTGQGIIMETLMLSEVPHFATGGSLHLIVNNQLGFTTPAHQGRSTMYCSDVAKMIGVPIIHVNGDHPEEVVRATKLALEYRQKFRRDVVMDLICFRRWGHNELDDPTFTNPEMYSVIHARNSVPNNYSEQLVQERVMPKEEVVQVVEDHTKFLSDHFAQTESYQPRASHLQGHWKGLIQAPPLCTSWDTGLDSNVLKYIGAKSVNHPEGFNVHSHLKKTHIQARVGKLTQGTNLDWATAEALAIGSLLYQGYNVRLSGQDVGRGTFSQRHVMLVDQTNGDIYIPLNSLVKDQKAFLEVANSPLSEEAVLGFEYGVSIESPNQLVLWEAQFGDFFNGAQIIIDTFVSSGETKWLLQSGLVMLLPHGYDGAGPEHSSAHIERFLQLCDSKEHGIDGDNVNMHIVHPTTPAQYFHLLRRQVLWNFRKPLVVASPKTLLRLSAATSSHADMGPGTSFKPVIGETASDIVKRIIFCSGKHYYALYNQRETLRANDVAIVRLEALCPFPTLELQREIKKYPKATTYIWSQEEHQNMGSWFFVNPRFENLVGCKLRYCGRRPLATPAVGVGQIHRQEVDEITAHPFNM